MKDLFGRLFGQEQKPRQEPEPAAPARREAPRQEAAEIYKKGDVTINALTDHEHPCQILADIFTFQEKCGSIQGKVVTFIGDGAGNIATSLIFAAGKADESDHLALDG